MAHTHLWSRVMLIRERSTERLAAQGDTLARLDILEAQERPEGGSKLLDGGGCGMIRNRLTIPAHTLRA